MPRRTISLACVPVLLAAALTGLVVTAPIGSAATATRCPWVGSTAPVPARVAQLLGRMSLAQKVTLLHGQLGSSYAGMTPAIAALCIPTVNFEDGPAGVGDGLTGVTQLPAPVAVAATWNQTTQTRYGSVLGAEEAAKGATVTLAPTVNLVRDPRWGRAFESTGEDPYLAGRTGSAIITGIQNQGQLAQVKHLAAYNQETNRNTPADNAIVSTRALQELYLPAFGTAVRDAAVASVMCSYSTVNGTPACANNYLQNTVLRGQFGFDGFVTSDWFATTSTVAAAVGGLDVEMPAGLLFGDALTSAVTSGQVPLSVINSHVSSILTQLFSFGLFDRAPSGSPTSIVTGADHTATARSVAAEGTVLLKNTGNTLPISTSTRRIAVIGDAAADHPLYAGGGSAAVTAAYGVAPLLGIQRRAPAGTTVTFDPGHSASSAAAAAANADVAVVFAGLPESESTDLPGIDLPGSINAVISAVAAANPHTVVVLNTGSAVTMPWINQVSSVLEAWYPGQENGTAAAQVLFGDVNPSGHLPVTFPRSLADVPARTAAQWPGTDGRVLYSEDLSVGYRWYDRQNITPLFPFGYGLSYTTFSYSDLSISPVDAGGTSTVAVTVTNTGRRAGADVAQLYVADPQAAGEPPRQLKGYQKVTLEPGASTRVTMPITLADLATWSTTSNALRTVTGAYTVAVGDSSRNLPLRGTLNVASAAARVSVKIEDPGPSNITAGAPVLQRITASSSTGNPPTFTGSGLPAGLSIGATGVIAGTPTRPGTSTVTVTAHDATGATGRVTFIVTVNPAGGAGGPLGPITGPGGLCLDVRGGSDAEGTAVLAFACNGTNAQQWTVRGDGTVRALGRCLSAAGTGDSAPIQLRACTGAAGQDWIPAQNGGITGPLVNGASGRCLDVPYGLAIPGVQLQLYRCNGTAAQSWTRPT